jgi:hypothetical protein
MMSEHALDNVPLQLLCGVVRESLTMPVRGIPGGPYAKHDRKCLTEYESISLTCECQPQFAALFDHERTQRPFEDITVHERLARCARAAFKTLTTRLGRELVPADLGLSDAEVEEIDQFAHGWLDTLHEDGSGDGNQDYPVGDLMHGIIWFEFDGEEVSDDELVDIAAKFCFAEPLLARLSRELVANWKRPEIIIEQHAVRGDWTVLVEVWKEEISTTESVCIQRIESHEVAEAIAAEARPFPFCETITFTSPEQWRKAVDGLGEAAT